MGRAFKRLGDTFETIGYHVERYNNRHRDDYVTRNVRRMRLGIVFLAGLFGLLFPITFFVQSGDVRLLLGVPLAIGAIALAAMAIRARTPARRLGRMVLALLVLGMMFTTMGLVSR